MKVIHKNISETIALLLGLGDGYSGEKFSIIFSAGDILTKSYVCSYDGSEYTNCEMADDEHVLCTLDNHGLPCGFLKASITVEFEDSKLADGTWTVGDTRLVQAIDDAGNPFHIELTTGKSDAYQTSEMTWELLSTVLHGKDGLTTAVKVNGEVHEQVDGVVDLGDIGGGSGTSNYNNLTNKPKIAGTELSGDKSLSDLGIQPEIEDIATIRSNAEAGATAVQPSAISDMETKTDAAETYQAKGNYVNDDDSRLSDAREPLAHTHTKSDVTDFSHTHTKSEITDFPTIPSTASDISTDEGISESKNVQADLTALALNIGSLNDLETSAKSNLVAAINEAAQSGGGTEDLILIRKLEFTEEVSEYSVSTDSDGNTFQLKKVLILSYYPKYTGSTTVPTYTFTTFNGKSGNGYIGGGKPNTVYANGGYYLAEFLNEGLFHEVYANGNGNIERGIGGGTSTTNTYDPCYMPSLLNKITSIEGKGLFYSGTIIRIYGVKV